MPLQGNVWPRKIRAMRAVAALAMMAAALAGCNSSPNNGVEAALASSGAEDSLTAHAPPALSRARVVLPAVPGNPAVAYFTLANPGSDPLTVTSIIIEKAAGATMHETVGNTMQPLPTLTVNPQTIVDFAPGGKHVMIDALNPSVQMGDRLHISAILADGRHVVTMATVEKPGEGDAGGAMGAMSGM